jgi:hypothetical protein
MCDRVVERPPRRHRAKDRGRELGGDVVGERAERRENGRDTHVRERLDERWSRARCREAFPQPRLAGPEHDVVRDVPAGLCRFGDGGGQLIGRQPVPIRKLEARWILGRVPAEPEQRRVGGGQNVDELCRAWHLSDDRWHPRLCPRVEAIPGSGERLELRVEVELVQPGPGPTSLHHEYPQLAVGVLAREDWLPARHNADHRDLFPSLFVERGDRRLPRPLPVGRRRNDGKAANPRGVAAADVGPPRQVVGRAGKMPVGLGGTGLERRGKLLPRRPFEGHSERFRRTGGVPAQILSPREHCVQRPRCLNAARSVP